MTDDTPVKPRVRDIMLPLSEYAVVSDKATLMEALHALQEAQQKVPDGRQPHRAVLVRNELGEITGKLGHLSFLRALLPGRQRLLADDVLDRAGVTDNMMTEFAETLGLLSSELVNITQRARNVLVAEYAAPAKRGLEENASVFEAIEAFVRHQTMSLLVTRGGRTVGILRIADLFDEVARQALEDERTP